MYDIILDSSIINRDSSFSGADMKLLKKLSSLELLHWHIPWIVYQEIVTHSQINGEKKIKELEKSLDNLIKFGQKPSLIDKMHSIKDNLSEIKIEFDSKAYWDSIVKEAKAYIDTFNSDLSYNVMCAYFNGDAPFPEPQSRKDIPDAFIYEHIKHHANSRQVIFVCGDKNLLTQCQKLNGVRGYNSLETFYKSDEYKPIEKKYESIEQYHKGLKLIAENIDSIKTQASEDVYGDLLIGFNQGIEHHNILSDQHDGVLTDVSNISNVKILLTDIKYVDNKFYIPVYIQCNFLIEYFLFKSDYPLYDDRRIRIIDNDWNDHYYLVNELFNASFVFNYSVDKETIDDNDMILHLTENIEALNLEPIC